MNLSEKIARVVKAPADDKFLLGDTVIIISGRAKGETGVLKKKIRTRTGLRYVVENCNMMTKHQKANPQAGIPGALKKVEGSIHSSNVAIFNLQTKKADKIRYVIEGGKKTRHYKSTGAEIAFQSSKRGEK